MIKHSLRGLMCLASLVLTGTAVAEQITAKVISVTEHRTLYLKDKQWLRSNPGKGSFIENWLVKPLLHVASFGLASPYNKGADNVTTLNIQFQLPSGVRAYGSLRIDSMVDEANEPIPYTVVTDGQWKRVNKSRVQVPIVLTVLPRDIRRITSVKGVLELLRGTTHQAEIIVPNTNVSSRPSTKVLKNALLTIKVYPVEVIEKKFSKGYRLKLVVSGHTGNYLGARVLTSDRQVVRTRSDKIIRPKPGETATLQHTLDLWHAPPGPLEVQVEVLSDSSTVQGRFSLTDIPLP